VRTTTYELVPVTRETARLFVAQHHRHNKAHKGELFHVGLQRSGELVGVAVASIPRARKLMQADPRLFEIVRTCVLEEQANANSMLYGALCRAGKNLGWLRAITYTLPEESGSSLKAAGFVLDAVIEPPKVWTRAGRYASDLFGNEERPPGPKVRWRREL
jgi:hypothetical protein